MSTKALYDTSNIGVVVPAENTITNSPSLLPLTPLFSFSTEHVTSVSEPTHTATLLTPTQAGTALTTTALSTTALSTSAVVSGGELGPFSLPAHPFAGTLSDANVDGSLSNAHTKSLPSGFMQQISLCIASEFTKLQNAQQQQFKLFEKRQIERAKLQRQEQMQCFDELRGENARAIEALNVRVDEILQLKNPVDDHDSKFAQLGSHITDIGAKLDAALQTGSMCSSAHHNENVISTMHDFAELIISGIPAAVHLSAGVLMHKVLSALKLDNLISDVLSSETFPRPSASRQPGASSSSTGG